MSDNDVSRSALLARPRLAADVIVHRPTNEELSGGVGADPSDAVDPWVVQKGKRTYIRISSDMAALLHALNGTDDHDDLAAQLGGPWTPDVVGQAIAMLERKGLLEDGSAPEATIKRITVDGPHRIQFTVVEPERLLKALEPVIRALGSKPARIVAGIIAIVGIISLFRSDVPLQLSTPLPLVYYLGIFVVILATGAVHELAHGAMLHAYGGRPSRMGVMLFYFSPAFFCDVTDGWRLPRARQRVHVAAAGIAVQVVLAGAIAIAAVVVQAIYGDGDLPATLVVLAVSSLIMCVVNLLPFVKLDGYLILMSHLDRPHLREKAIADARSWLSSVLFGAKRKRSLSDLRWAVPFGLACMAMPLYMVSIVVAQLGDLLLGAGVVGQSILLLVLIGCAGYLLRGGARLLKAAQAAGGRKWRLIAIPPLLLALFGAFASIPVIPYSVVGGFVTEGGTTSLVLPVGAQQVPPLAKVELRRAGLYTSTLIGTATVLDEPERGVNAPIMTLIPIDFPAVVVPMQGRPMRLDQGAPVETAGATRVDLGTVSAWRWLERRYIEPIIGTSKTDKPQPERSTP